MQNFGFGDISLFNILLQMWPLICWRICSIPKERFSGHRTGITKNPFADNKCKILRKHFSIGLCRNADYTVNIVEKLSGSGRDDNGIPVPGITLERQKEEMKLMFTLKTLYPYGLNDRVSDEYMAEQVTMNMTGSP